MSPEIEELLNIANRPDFDSQPIPEGSMRVAPGSDAVVWRVCPDYKAEL